MPPKKSSCVNFNAMQLKISIYLSCLMSIFFQISKNININAIAIAIAI